MNFNSFIKRSAELWNAHLSNAYSLQLLGKLSPRSSTALFPSFMLCTETDRHFIMELIGAQRNFSDLAIKVHKETSTNRYFGQFSTHADRPLFELAASAHQFSNLTMSRALDPAATQRRFPWAPLLQTGLYTDGDGSLIRFAPSFQSGLFENCLFVNEESSMVRAKYMLFAIVVSKELEESSYREWMLGTVLRTRQVRGVHRVDKSRAESFMIAGQFANLFLSPGLRETTIGEFLRSHPTLLNTAFGSRKFIYEPTLQWKDGNSGGDTSINPDILLQRDDGFFDIFDLKTAALERSAITKGPRRRRRFIDYVEEGVAQLAHYREYFLTPENAAHAREKYGVEVSQPQLTLVVGNYDNANLAQVEEASRRLNGIGIVDYDSLIQLFLSKHRTAARPSGDG